MIIETLKVDGKLLDMGTNSLSRKIAVSKVGDITSKKSNYSNQFKLKRTSRNTEILGFVGVAGNTSNLPYKLTKASYSVDTIPVVVDGFLSIERVDKDYFYVRLKDGIIDISSRLKGLRLSDLPLSDLDHYLNSGTFTNSFSNTSGYIYGYADFGADTGVSKIEYMKPSFFVSTIWSKIFSSIGVSFQGNFFNIDPEYAKEVITPFTGVEPVDDLGDVIDKGEVQSNEINVSESDNNYIEREDEFTLTGSNLTDFSIVDGNLVSNFDGRLQLEIDVDYRNNDCYLYLRGFVNGQSRLSYNLPIDNTGNETVEVNIEINSGDVISFSLLGQSIFNDDDGGNGFQLHTLNYEADIEANVRSVEGGMFVKASDIIGDMKQTDFIRDVMNRHGLFMTPVTGNNNAYRFTKIDRVLRDRDTANDWTEKLQISSISEKHKPPLSKSNLFQFTYEKDVVDFYRDGSLLVDNENISDEQSLYKSPFTIPLKSNLDFNSAELYSIPLYEDDDGQQVVRESDTKLMSLEYLDTTAIIRFFDDTNTTFSGLFPILNIEGLDMQKYIENNYKQYSVLVNKYKQVTADVLLTPIDIYNLRFDRLKYFKQLGRYFFLDEVTNKAGKMSRVIMNEIFSFDSNEPPYNIGSYSFDITVEGSRSITLESITTQFLDNEFNNPEIVRILGGFGQDVRMFNNGIELTGVTDIPVNDVNLTVTDTLDNISARSYNFPFTVSDDGSGLFSDNTGNIAINVIAYIPVNPNADAGDDLILEINDDINFEILYDTLNGAGTTSTDDIASYSWEIINRPVNSLAQVSFNSSQSYADFEYPNDESSLGNYLVRLTVTTVFGLTDTDDMEITINNGTIIIDPD